MKYAPLCHRLLLLKDSGQAALHVFLLPLLRTKTTGRGSYAVGRGAEEGSRDERILEEFCGGTGRLKASFPSSRWVGNPKAPFSHRKGKEGAKGGNLLDSGVKKGREEDFGQCLLQWFKGCSNIWRDALNVLPLGLE
jgi:hypothetical protein